MATKKPSTKQVAKEAALFAARIGLLVFLPLAIQWTTDLKGVWHSLFTYVLPVALPIVDKWIHEDPRVPANGLLPF